MLSMVYAVEQWRRVVTNELTVFDALPTVGLWPPCELRTISEQRLGNLPD